MQEAIIPSQHLSIILCYLAVEILLNTWNMCAISQYTGITADGKHTLVCMYSRERKIWLLMLHFKVFAAELAILGGH